MILTGFFFILGVVPTGAYSLPRQGNKQIDQNVTSFELRQNKRVDVFDFTGEYTNLENIDIDGRRLREVEMLLVGEYPLLTSINYDGGLGAIKGELTGRFPLLEEINFSCRAASLALDLAGIWERNCEINLSSHSAQIILNLPKDIGVIVHTRTNLGKVIKGSLKKKGWGLLNKTYVNELYQEAPITLVINIENKDGRIILN